jgi:hypothetical protein
MKLDHLERRVAEDEQEAIGNQVTATMFIPKYSDSQTRLFTVLS